MAIGKSRSYGGLRVFSLFGSTLFVVLGLELGLDSWTCECLECSSYCVDIVESWKIIGTNFGAESLTVLVFSGCSSIASMIISLLVFQN